MPMAIMDQTTQAELPATINKMPEADARRVAHGDWLEEQGEHRGDALDGFSPGSPIYARYQRDNPLRPVNWRWRHAKALVAARRLCPKRDDKHAVAAARFFRALDRCRTDRARSRLEQ